MVADIYWPILDSFKTQQYENSRYIWFNNNVEEINDVHVFCIIHFSWSKINKYLKKIYLCKISGLSANMCSNTDTNTID